MSVQCDVDKYYYDRVSVCWSCGLKFCWSCAKDSSQLNGAAQCPKCHEWTEKQTSN